MLIGTIIWILSVGSITYKLDITLLKSSNSMSDNHHFLIFSFLIMACLYICYKMFFYHKCKDLYESFIWITYITAMSASCRNALGDDLDWSQFVLFSLAILYLIYIYRYIYPKEEVLIIPRILVVNLIVLKIFWPTIVYVWPYGEDYPDDYDWTGWPGWPPN